MAYVFTLTQRGDCSSQSMHNYKKNVRFSPMCSEIPLKEQAINMGPPDIPPEHFSCVVLMHAGAGVSRR